MKRWPRWHMTIAKDMNPIDNHQGRGDTKRRQAAVLLQRVLKDMIARMRACLSITTLPSRSTAGRSAPRSRRACISPIFCATRLRLTGTHVGCEHGVCGACNVMIDGRSVRSCLTLAVQADGANVETIEGLTERNAIARAAARVRRPQRTAMRLSARPECWSRRPNCSRAAIRPERRSATPFRATTVVAPAIRRSSMRSKPLRRSLPGRPSHDRQAASWIGRSMPRREAKRLAEGRGRYTDDLDVANVVHVAFLRSPHAHARIRRIDDRGGRAVAGCDRGGDGRRYRRDLQAVADAACSCCPDIARRRNIRSLAMKPAGRARPSPRSLRRRGRRPRTRSN